MNTYEKLRKKVIMALHPDCESYEEAVKKEFIQGCNIKIDENCWDKKSKKRVEVLHFFEDEVFEDEGECWRLFFMSKDELLVSQDIINVFTGEQMLRNEKDYSVTILGLPITLPRLMQALFVIQKHNYESRLKEWNNDKGRKDRKCPIFKTDEERMTDVFYSIFTSGWKMISKFKGSTLEDQDEETILKIIELIK